MKFYEVHYQKSKTSLRRYYNMKAILYTQDCVLQALIPNGKFMAFGAALKFYL